MREIVLQCLRLFLCGQKHLAALTDNREVSLPLVRLRFALARRDDGTTPRRFEVEYQRLGTLLAASALGRRLSGVTVGRIANRVRNSEAACGPAGRHS